MTQGRRIAAVLAITGVATVTAAATAPALSLPGTTTPTVTIPTVTVPPVSTPVVTTPTVTVPKATAPKVTIPPVKAAPPGGGGVKVTPPKVTPPSVSPPKVTSPPVSTPKVTQLPGTVSGGLVRVPSSGAGGTAAGGATRSGSTSAGSAGSVVSPIFGGTPGGPGGGAVTGPGGFAGPGGAAGGPGSPSAFALGLPRSIEGPGGTGGVSAFAAAVGSLAGCFYALTPFEQQILTVRTGIDGREPLTRSQVAALLGTSPAAIGQTERTALGELQSAARTSGCMPVGLSGPANALTAFVGGPFGPIGFVTPGIPPASRTEPGAGGQPHLATTSFAEQLRLSDVDKEASLSVLVILAVMLSGALGALFVEARRSVH